MTKFNHYNYYIQYKNTYTRLYAQHEIYILNLSHVAQGGFQLIGNVNNYATLMIFARHMSVGLATGKYFTGQPGLSRSTLYQLKKKKKKKPCKHIQKKLILFDMNQLMFKGCKKKACNLTCS